MSLVLNRHPDVPTDVRTHQPEITGTLQPPESESSKESLLEFTGPPGQMYLFIGFIAWITATLRLPLMDVKGPCYSNINLEVLPTKKHHPRPLNLKICLELLRPLDPEAHSWAMIFPGTVVAYGFPVPRHPEPDMVGLRIPFPVMLEYSLMLYDHAIRDEDGITPWGAYLAGASNVLYPTKISSDKKTVQWHLVELPKEVHRTIRHTQWYLMKDAVPAMVMEKDIQVLADAVAILG